MYQAIEHTDYGWKRKRNRVVLYHRQSLRLLWGIGMYISVSFTISPLAMGLPLVLSSEKGGDPFTVLFLLTWALVSACLSYFFYKSYKRNREFWIPNRYLKIDNGIKLNVTTHRQVLSTGSGGTFKDPHVTRWLVIEYPNGKHRRLQQIFNNQELELISINCALAMKV